jgi:hypothetical protein
MSILPPGRVQVIVQPLPLASPTRRSLVDAVDEIKQAQRARGYLGRATEEMLAENAARREEDEEYDRRCEQLGPRLV